MKSDDLTSYYNEKACVRLRDRFLLLPGESSIEYRLLQIGVAEELAPVGELEEDAVNTIVKCIWRKQRYQHFLKAKLLAAALRPGQLAYVEALGLGLFLGSLGEETDFEELNRLLDCLGGSRAEELRRRCPRRNFSTGEDMNKALRAEAAKLYERALCGRPSDEFLMIQSVSVFTDDVFARELEFENEIDAQLDRALGRLFKIREAKRQISVHTRQLFNQLHVPSPEPVRKRKPRRIAPTTSAPRSPAPPG